MDTAWRFRLVLIMTFAIIIFGDMLGYANVKGDKDSNQRSVDSTLKKPNSNQKIQRNGDGKIYLFTITLPQNLNYKPFLKVVGDRNDLKWILFILVSFAQNLDSTLKFNDTQLVSLSQTDRFKVS